MKAGKGWQQIFVSKTGGEKHVFSFCSKQPAEQKQTQSLTEQIPTKESGRKQIPTNKKTQTTSRQEKPNKGHKGVEANLCLRTAGGPVMLGLSHIIEVTILELCKSCSAVFGCFVYIC